MFAQVERLVDNLHRIGLPAMEQRKPARQRSELLEIVSEFENFDAAWIDETIEAWWSWHDGITEPADSPWPGVSPDGLAIHSFRGVLEAFEGRLAMAADEGKDIEAITRSTMFEMPVIPLVDEADIICLRKGSPHPDAPWELWTYGTELPQASQALNSADGNTHNDAPAMNASSTCAACTKPAPTDSDSGSITALLTLATWPGRA